MANRGAADTGTPIGRDDVTEALVTAATELFTDLAPGDVSIRAIAARAGVNHGLVHRHIGGKLDVARCVLDRAVADVRESLPPTEDPLERLLAIVESAMREPVFSRVLAWATLGGIAPGELHNSRGLLREVGTVLQLLGLDDHEAMAADLAVRTLGWTAYEGFIVSTGLVGDDVERARTEHLARIERDVRSAISRSS